LLRARRRSGSETWRSASTTAATPPASYATKRPSSDTQSAVTFAVTGTLTVCFVTRL
jgi:hypothetical protein